MENKKIIPLWKLERAAILDALRIFEGNRTHAADALGISLRTLRNKIRSYQEAGIKVPSPDGTTSEGSQHESD